MRRDGVISDIYNFPFMFLIRKNLFISVLSQHMIQPSIAKELTSMMQTWLMNKAACPLAVRQEPDNTLNLLNIDFWLWY